MALVCTLLLAGLISGPVEAQKRQDPLAGLTDDQRRVFQNYTRLYCKQFFRFDEDRFVLLPNYMRSRENSSGKSYDQAREEMTEYVDVGLGRQKAVVPPKSEVIIAAKVIPAIDVGHYGFINSVVVKDVIGPSEMIVGSVELISKGDVGTTNNDLRKAAANRQRLYKNQSYRLLGFSTKGLVKGQKYYGPKEKGLQVAVMSTDPRHDFVMVNYDRLKRIRTTEFHEVLAYVKIEPLDFLKMVRENRQALGAQGNQASLRSIYRRYYNRYRPKRLSSTTQAEPRPEPRPQTQPKPETKQEPDVEPDVEPQPREPKYGPIEREPKPKPTPEPKPEPEPEVDAPPRPDPVDEQGDDWDLEEDTQDDSDSPDFFGVPL